MTTEERGTVRCSCGTVWLSLTVAEAEELGRTHDDSPGMNHVVSSMLFVDQAKRARDAR